MVGFTVFTDDNPEFTPVPGTISQLHENVKRNLQLYCYIVVLLFKTQRPAVAFYMSDAGDTSCIDTLCER